MKKRLTDRLIQSLKPLEAQYDVFDDVLAGLGVRVNPSGSRTFFLRYNAPDGRRRRLPLGRWELGTDCGGARELAKAAAAEALRGVDPQRARRAAASVFRLRNLMEQYLGSADARQLAPSTLVETRRLLTLAVDRIGERPAAEVTRAEVRALLDAIAADTPVQANRLLSWLRRAFNWALDHDLIPANPCARLRRPASEMPRDRVLRDEELAVALVTWLLDRKPRSLACLLELLTTARPGEVAAMQWDEIDLHAATWLLPGRRRLKSRTPHLMPLVSQAVELLLELGPRSSGPVLLGSRGEIWDLRPGVKIAREACRAAGLGDDWTAHDLRRTSATLLQRFGGTFEDAGQALGHARRGPTAVYARWSDLEERRRLQQAMADRLEEIAGLSFARGRREVLPFKRAGVVGKATQ